MNVVDAHVHPDLKNHPDIKDAARTLLSRMDAAGIKKAIVMPNGLDCSMDTVVKICALSPDRLWGFYMHDIRDGIDRTALRGLFEAGHFKGIKIHPRAQKIALNDPSVDAFLEKCVFVGAPVFIDCFPFGELDERNYPLAFERIAKKFPSLRIILGHMGGYRVMDAFIVAKSNGNITLDLSLTLMYYRGSSVEADIAYALKMLGPKRFIYGSDYPNRPIEESFSNCVKFLKSSGLDDGGVSDIMGRNIEVLIGTVPKSDR